LEQIELKAKVRKNRGNGPARRLRSDGKVPAVLYGPKTEPVLLTVNLSDIEQILRSANVGQALLSLVIQNGQESTRPVMIKELQTHPVSGRFLHIDFYEIDLERKIRAMVPVVTSGQSKGVELGGLLQTVRHEVEVFCLPTQIPETIEVDVTDLDIGDSIHVEEIQLEGDVEILFDVNFTVVTVYAPKVEAEPEEEEEELEEEAAEAEGEEAEAEQEAPEATEAE
jgi:large subunit ribosomal protein L25